MQENIDLACVLKRVSKQGTQIAHRTFTDFTYSSFAVQPLAARTKHTLDFLLQTSHRGTCHKSYRLFRVYFRQSEVSLGYLESRLKQQQQSFALKASQGTEEKSSTTSAHRFLF